MIAQLERLVIECSGHVVSPVTIREATVKYRYLGVGIFGPTIEANPLISSAIAGAGVVAGLGTAKAIAIGFGIVLHLRRVHNLVALLTAIYFTAAILPWTALFLTN